MYTCIGYCFSGVNPGIIWPSKPELDELVEIDEKWEPSFQELKQNIEEKNRQQREEKELRYCIM